MNGKSPAAYKLRTGVITGKMLKGKAIAAALLCHRAGVQPIGHRLSLRPQTLTYDQTA